MRGVERFALRVALALVVLGFVPGLLDPFNAPKAALLRMVGLVLLAATPWWAARGGAARPDAPRRLEAGRLVDGAVIAWMIVAALATAFGTSPRLSLLGEIEQREGLLTVLALGGLYAAARRTHDSPAEVRTTLAVLVAAAATAALYAVIQRAGLDPFQWANAAFYPGGTGAVLRPFGTLGNPILLGAALAPALAVMIAQLAWPRGFAWRAPLAGLMAVAITMTLSRSAWLAAAAGAAAAALGAARAWPARRARAGAALALVAAATGLWAVLGARESVVARAGEGIRSSALSLPVRTEIARSALALWRQRPWLGVGPDAFGLEFPAVQSAGLWRREWIGTPVHAHSAALQVLATLGAAGAIAGLAWLAAVTVALAVAASRRRRDAAEPGAESVALPAAMLALVVGGALNPVGLAGAAAFVVLSALAANGSRDPEEIAEPVAPGGWRSRGAAATSVAVLALAAMQAARELPAMAAAGTVQGAMLASLDRPELERGPAVRLALDRAAVATSRAPGEDELWRLESDAALSALRARILSDPELGDSLARRAESAARRALRLEPRRANNYQRLANALAVEARLALAAPGTESEPAGASGPGTRWEPLAAAAEAAFAEAERRAPCDALILTDHVSAELALHRGAQALAPSRRIVALYPEAASGHALEGASWLTLGRIPEARAALLLARSARWETEDSTRRQRVEAILRAIEVARPLR